MKAIISSIFVLLLLCLVALVSTQEFPSEKENTKYLTTNNGVPVFDDEHSLTVGVRGPTLLEDFYLQEKLAHLDRERIPERLAHARGATAKGHFQVTGDVSKYTFADFLQPNKKTYTEEGNYDIVGLDFPIFAIRDAMKFPDLVHALKPDPVTNSQEWWRIWDFFSHQPESIFFFTYLLDDLGLPTDYRHMDGFGVHAFKWISSTGKSHLVKYHWVSGQGIASLINDSQVQAITSPVHATLDLYNSIERGDFPYWELQVQIMEPNETSSLDFDPLDATKVWPEDQFPPMTVGVMTLDQNIDNFFNENEQLALSPANLVPGISVSDDKLLQGRLFSYPDTQRYRIGGNYLLLPVNAPKCPFHNNNYDGVMNFVHRKSHVNYFPSHVDPTRNASPFPTNKESLRGVTTRASIPLTNDFDQPSERFESFDPARKTRFINRLISTLQPPLLPSIREDVIKLWEQVDDEILGPALRAAFPQ